MTVAIFLVWMVTMAIARLGDPLPVILVVSVPLAAVVAWRDRPVIRELTRLTPRIAALSFAATAVMVAATYLLYSPLVDAAPQIVAWTHAIYGRFLSARAPGLLIVAVIPVNIAEEFLWRGEVQRSMRRWSVLTTATVYAAAHVALGSPLLVVVAFVCGLYWSTLRKMSGSLIPSICAHIVWVVTLIAFPLVR